jgi:hypothetical protein
MSLHIYKQVKFQLDWHLRNMTRLCIRPNDSNGKVIPSYKCGWMEEFDMCFAYNIMRVLWGMLMKSWAILGFDGPIVCFKHNIGGKGCNYRFKVFFSMYGVHMTKCKDILTHLPLIYNYYSSWGLVIW